MNMKSTLWFHYIAASCRRQGLFPHLHLFHRPADNESVRIPRETILSYGFLAKWLAISLTAGIVGTGIVRVFFLLQGWIAALLSGVGLPLVIWPVVGALITGGIVYRIKPAAAGEGIPGYLEGMNENAARFPLGTTLMKFAATVGTLTTYGNGGVVGPLGRVTSGLISFLVDKSRRIGLNDYDRRTAAICGMAAAVGAVFHSSIGGGVFAVEIIQKSEMRYRDLFPAILASSMATHFSRVFGWDPFFAADIPARYMNPGIAGIVLLTAVLTGFAGKFYIATYRVVARLLRREAGSRMLVKTLTGSVVAAVLAWAVDPELMGTSKGIVDMLLAPEATRTVATLSILAALLYIPVKAAANIATVGSGMSAGFTGPSLILGMLLGYVLSGLFGVPAYSPEYYAILGAGFTAMLASSINVPIAAAILGLELFGLHYGLPCGVAAVIGFQMNRHRTLYDYAQTGAAAVTDEEADIPDS